MGVQEDARWDGSCRGFPSVYPTGTQQRISLEHSDDVYTANDHTCLEFSPDGTSLYLTAFEDVTKVYRIFILDLAAGMPPPPPARG